MARASVAALAGADAGGERRASVSERVTGNGRGHHAHLHRTRRLREALRAAQAVGLPAALASFTSLMRPVAQS